MIPGYDVHFNLLAFFQRWNFSENVWSREKAFASSVYFSVVVAAIMLLTLDRETSTTDQIIFIDLLCSLSLSFALSLLHGFAVKFQKP